MPSTARKLTLAAAAAIAAIAAGPANAAIQVFTGSGFSLPDSRVPQSSTITIGSLGTINSLTLTLNGFTHSYMRDFDSFLTRGTTEAQFMSNDAFRPQSTNGDYTFADGASSIYSATATVAPGTYSGRQENGATQNFGVFAGQSTAGLWTLTMTDQQNQDAGSLASWSLALDYTPLAAAVPEPATWGMMMLGLGAVGGAARRRRAVAVRFARA